MRDSLGVSKAGEEAMTTPNTETQKLSDDEVAAEAFERLYLEDAYIHPRNELTGKNTPTPAFSYFLAGIAHARQQPAPGESEEIASLKAELEQYKYWHTNCVKNLNAAEAERDRYKAALEKVEKRAEESTVLTVVVDGTEWVDNETLQTLSAIQGIARAALKGEKEQGNG